MARTAQLRRVVHIRSQRNQLLVDFVAALAREYQQIVSTVVREDLNSDLLKKIASVVYLANILVGKFVAGLLSVDAIAPVGERCRCATVPCRALGDERFIVGTFKAIDVDYVAVRAECVAVKDVEVLLAEEEDAFCGVEALDTGASVYQVDAFAVLEKS